MKNSILAVVIATIWISFSEFFRNEYVLKAYWTQHYQKLGIEFPSEPINGIVWGIWSLCLAIGIFILSKKYHFFHTSMLTWFFSFVMMWLVVGNMAVLPFSILVFAIPLSLVEVFLASFIIYKINSNKSKK